MGKEELQYCTILKTNINVTDMDQTISYITRNLEELRAIISVFPMCIRP